MLKAFARFGTEIGQQQNNMKRFYKEAIYEANPTKKHPFHKYRFLHPAISLLLTEKLLKHHIEIL